MTEPNQAGGTYSRSVKEANVLRERIAIYLIDKGIDLRSLTVRNPLNVAIRQSADPKLVVKLIDAGAPMVLDTSEDGWQSLAIQTLTGCSFQLVFISAECLPPKSLVHCFVYIGGFTLAT